MAAAGAETQRVQVIRYRQHIVYLLSAEQNYNINVIIVSVAAPCLLCNTTSFLKRCSRAFKRKIDKDTRAKIDTRADSTQALGSGLRPRRSGLQRYK